MTPGVRLVGVIDLMGGVAVRAVAGRREEYRPLVSRLCPTPEPVAVARVLLRAGVAELYVADLDAIGGAEPAWGVLGRLVELGAPLWVDAGVRDHGRGLELELLGVHRVVAGLETLPDPAALRDLAEVLADRAVFSLDLRDGRPLGAWGADPEAVARRAVEQGIRRVLVLDLARVGVGAGPGTAGLCARLAAAHPGVEVSAGGGVRGPADVAALRAAGVSAVLVASALHDGRIDPRADS